MVDGFRAPSTVRAVGRRVVALLGCMSVVLLGGTGHAQTSISGRTLRPAPAVMRPATFNSSPIVLTGNQSLTISDPDYTVKNNITLHDSSTLIITDSTFMHASDYSGQFSLRAYDNARVIIERSTIRSSPWINWSFFDSASLQMTDVTNGTSAIWHNFLGQSVATIRNVSRFPAAVSFFSSLDIDGAREVSFEPVLPARSVVDESFPAAMGSAPYVFPNDDDRGVNFRLRVANAASANWGVTILPESDITFRDTRIGIGIQLPSSYSGLVARFDNLRSRLYADDAWSVANGVLRLKNTVATGWYASASGDNRLSVTNSTLADMSGSQDQAEVSIADSTMSYTLARQFVRIDIARSMINGDVVATDNGIITITDSAVSGRLVREGNGLIVASGVTGLGRGFSGRLTGDPAEVISGRASIKGSHFGSESYSAILSSDPNVIRLSANQTYRLTFRYRIVTAPSNGFEVSFLSQKGIAAGNFLPGLTITGRDGETGTATLTTRLGPYDDYWAKWGIVATGALVVDDIQLVDVATGQVVASEGGESPLTVESPAPAPVPGSGALTILPQTLPTLTVGVPVSITLAVDGGTGTGWVFSPNSVGSQIPGLVINTPGPGMLSGTPTTAGPYLRGFTVTDSGGNTGTIVYSGTVLPAR